MATKVCSKCGEEKDLVEGFYASQGVARSRCKACIISMSAAWKLANPEREKAVRRARDLASTEKRKAERAQRYIENRQRVLEAAAIYRKANAEKIKEYHRQRQKANPESSRASSRRRRAFLKGCDGPHHTVADAKALFTQQQGRCAYCLLDLDGSYHLDHVVPLARGGNNSKENIALACPACNMAKHDKLLYSEWTPPIQNILLDAAVMLMYSS